MSLWTYLDIIKPDHPGRVHCPIVGSGLLGVGLHALNQLLGERRIEHVQDVAQGGIQHLIVVGQTVELVRLEVEVDSAALPHTVGVRVSVVAAALGIN